MPFSGGYPRLTLSATLPCDARTFLTVIPFGNIPRGRPTKLPKYYNTFEGFCQGENALGEADSLPMPLLFVLVTVLINKFAVDAFTQERL